MGVNGPLADFESFYVKFWYWYCLEYYRFVETNREDFLSDTNSWQLTN